MFRAFPSSRLRSDARARSRGGRKVTQALRSLVLRRESQAASFRRCESMPSRRAGRRNVAPGERAWTTRRHPRRQPAKKQHVTYVPLAEEGPERTI